MSNTYLAFDIGTRNIHLVEGQVSGTTVKIFNSTIVELTRGTIKDGLIAKQETLSLALQTALDRIAASSQKATITINSNSVIIREFIIPAGDPQELKAMIDNEISQYFGISASDLVEYRKIAEFEEKGQQKVKIRVAVLNREIAESYLRLLEDIGLEPEALDIHPNVISKLFSGQPVINGETLEESYILLDIGYTGSMIYLLSQGNLDFFRAIGFGGKAIDSLLAKLLSIPEEEAENKKLEYLSGANTPEYYEILTAVRPLYGDLLEELRKVVQYFQSRSSGRVLNKIYLMGGGAPLTGLAPYLAQGLGFEVKQLQRLNTIQLQDNQPALANIVNAAGALIRL
ncbi:MAG TPA: type IV pilus assembly protein PilM [Desulfitobacteriaceae bacterium]|nr:type IV pilus assembly protein PilM [Desulfitobacteriaceae bacterium]